MHYRPFSFEDYPELADSLSDSVPDFQSQSCVRNFAYFDGVVAMTVVSNLKSKDYVFDLNKPQEIRGENESLVKKALKYRLSSLEESDRLDTVKALSTYPTLFEVRKAFRGIAQSFGGRRYVALCHDLIDDNMGQSLHPYMAVDLIAGVFYAYNKNVNRDVTGLLTGLIELIGAFDLSLMKLWDAFSVIGQKSGEGTYEEFASLCLKDEKLCEPMQEFLARALGSGQLDGRYFAPRVSYEMFHDLPKDLICEVLEYLPGGMKAYAARFFDECGEQIDPDYVRAYLKNPSRDPRLILNAKFFDGLPEEMRLALKRSRAYSPSALTDEWIRYFQEAETEEEKAEVLRAAREYGNGQLANALEGKEFVLQQFNLTEMAYLMPYVDQNSPNMVARLTAYLRPFIDKHYASNGTDRIFDALRQERFSELVAYAIRHNGFKNKAVRLRVAERFNLLSSMGYEEWKYHD